MNIFARIGNLWKLSGMYEEKFQPMFDKTDKILTDVQANLERAVFITPNKVNEVFTRKEDATLDEVLS